ncbi:MAG: ABC transporter ATP-binding protein [Oscillospiraceae bacterium]
MNNSIEINSITKAYKDFVLDNVSFNVPYGSIMGFIGENGAGKTTTIKAILNIIRINSGSITVFDKDIKANAKDINKDIGTVLDGSFFYEGMEARDIAPVMRRLYKTWDDKYFTQLLSRFSLPANKIIKEYSKGMKMKLNLATALAHKPKLLILDEATSGLDPVVRNEMLDIFLEFIQEEEHSILMSSHITTDLEKIADYITFLHEGKVVFSKSKDDIMENYAVAKCSVEKANALPHELIMGRRSSQFGCELLVSDKVALRRKEPDIIIDHASLDDIMTFIAKEGK